MAGRDARRPRNRLWFVLAGEPCPFLMCPLAHKACVLDAVPGRLTSKDRFLNTPVRAGDKGWCSPCGNLVLVFGFGVMCLQGPWQVG